MFSYRNCIALTICLAFIGVSVEGSTPFRRCTEDILYPDFIQINDCEASPCTLVSGTVTNMSVGFTTVKTIQKISAEGVSYINGNPFPFPIPEDGAEVCNYLANGVKCPLNAGQNVTYSFSVPLDKDIPDVFATIEIALLDEEKLCISCFVFDIHLKSAGEENEKEQLV